MITSDQFCNDGSRSAFASTTVKQRGFSNEILASLKVRSYTSLWYNRNDEITNSWASSLSKRLGDQSVKS